MDNLFKNNISPTFNKAEFSPTFHQNNAVLHYGQTMMSGSSYAGNINHYNALIKYQFIDNINNLSPSSRLFNSTKVSQFLSTHNEVRESEGPEFSLHETPFYSNTKITNNPAIIDLQYKGGNSQSPAQFADSKGAFNKQVLNNQNNNSGAGLPNVEGENSSDFNLSMSTQSQNSNDALPTEPSTPAVPDQSAEDRTSPISSLQSNTIHGTEKNDRLYSNHGDDVIYGYQGDDTIKGGAGDDDLFGGKGDDTFLLDDTHEGVDNFFGGSGHDTISANNTVDTIHLGEEFGTDNAIEEIIGGSDGVDISGTDQNDQWDFSQTDLCNINEINTGIGDDQVMGSQHDDVIRGGSGNDTMYGGSGNDTFVYQMGDGNDLMVGGQGWSDQISLEGMNGQLPNTGDWTMQIEPNTSYTVSNNTIEFLNGDASGSLVFNDGSQIEFTDIEQIIF